jgi:hypothetical protein
VPNSQVIWLWQLVETQEQPKQQKSIGESLGGETVEIGSTDSTPSPALESYDGPENTMFGNHRCNGAAIVSTNPCSSLLSM